MLVKSKEVCNGGVISSFEYSGVRQKFNFKITFTDAVSATRFKRGLVAMQSLLENETYKERDCQIELIDRELKLKGFQDDVLFILNIVANMSLSNFKKEVLIFGDFKARLQDVKIEAHAAKPAPSNPLSMHFKPAPVAPAEGQKASNAYHRLS